MYLQLMYLQFHIYKNIPVSFDFITTWNQGVFLCSPCIKHVGYIALYTHFPFSYIKIVI